MIQMMMVANYRNWETQDGAIVDVKLTATTTTTTEQSIDLIFNFQTLQNPRTKNTSLTFRHQSDFTQDEICRLKLALQVKNWKPKDYEPLLKEGRKNGRQKKKMKWVNGWFGLSTLLEQLFSFSFQPVVPWWCPEWSKWGCITSWSLVVH